MSDGQLIEKLIHKAHSSVADEERKKRAARQEQEKRRDDVLKRIGQAAIDHELPLGQSADAERILALRLEQARRVRISKAEAMATLAETQGDFESPLDWWEITSPSGTVLWKDYVIARRSARYRTVTGPDGSGQLAGCDESSYIYIDINVRQDCRGVYVAELYIDEQEEQSIGISQGEHASALEAAEMAYTAYFRKRGIEVFALPPLIPSWEKGEDKLDKEDEAKVG